jgi:hypothetical protein
MLQFGSEPNLRRRTHVINVSAHAAHAIGESRSNPGLVTAVTLLLPSAGVGVHTWINAGRMTLTEAVLGIFLAAYAAAGSREYQRQLRRLRSSSSRLEPYTEMESYHAAKGTLAR